MKLNPAKCCTMTVTFCKRPPQPEPLFIDNVELNVVTEAKILGVVIQANFEVGQPYFARSKKVQQKTVHVL